MTTRVDARAHLEGEWSEVEVHELADLAAAGTLTRDDVFSAMTRVGRVNAPAVLFDVNGLGLLGGLSAADLASLTCNAWSAAEYPDETIYREWWVEMFQNAGYSVEGVPASPPAEPMRLYRGAVTEPRERMAWTDNREVAEKFAHGLGCRPKNGTVWTALVEPGRLLAHLAERSEDEYVIDPTGLDIRPAD